jgi:hypothetical protein
VTGRQFNDLHKFFKEQYEELKEFVDAVAERTRSPGSMAFGAAIIPSLRKDLVTCDEQYHDWRSMKRWPRCCGRPWKGSLFKAAVLALEERPFVWAANTDTSYWPDLGDEKEECCGVDHPRVR